MAKKLTAHSCVCWLLYLTDVCDDASKMRLSSALLFRMISRVTGPSPAMFPNAQTACSATILIGDDSNFTNLGMASALTTENVWSDVPDATFVSAQAASNCKLGLSEFIMFTSILFIVGFSILDKNWWLLISYFF